MSSFTKGKQPCSKLRPKQLQAGYDLIDDYHYCTRCTGKVLFCENCHKDHHSNGYETCSECEHKWKEVAEC